MEILLDTVIRKSSLRSDGQQFHQYQTPITSNHWTKKASTYGVVIQGPAFGQELEYGSVKPFYGIPTPLDNWISNDNADINKK